MNKKDYILLASQLGKAFHAMALDTGPYSDAGIKIRDTGFNIALGAVLNALKSDNTNFNERVFLNAIFRQS